MQALWFVFRGGGQPEVDENEPEKVCPEGEYATQELCETEVHYALCSENTETTCWAPSACKSGNGYMINGGPGSHVYSEALATFGYNKCYQVLGCKNEEALDTNIFTTRVQSFADLDCEVATGCQTGYVTSCSTYSTEYEKYSAYNTSGSLVNCMKCECEYSTASACQTDYPYATCTSNSSGCFEPTACNTSAGYDSRYSPYFKYENAGTIGSTTCYKINGCSDTYKVYNENYINTTDLKYGNTTCAVFSGCRADRDAYTTCPSGTTEATSLNVATTPGGEIYCKICQTSSNDCDCGDACEQYGDSSSDCQRQKECEASCNSSSSTTTFTCDYQSYSAISKLDSSNPASGTNYDICGWKVATKSTSNGATTWSLTEQWIQYCCTSSACNYSSTSNPPGISTISHYVDSHCGVITSGNNYYVYLK